jgi:nucleotide-binding universal stress UspA family protein
LLLGSVSQQCALHAPCPLVVVRDGSTPSAKHDSIVVGVDVSPRSDAALEWAFAEAHRRGVDVVAVHAWSLPVSASIGYVPAQTVDAVRDAAAAAVTATVERVGRRYPDVRCDQRVASGSAALALVDAAGDAALLVVGTRGRGGFAGLVLGSTSQYCAHHARCPIVIVRSQG